MPNRQPVVSNRSKLSKLELHSLLMAGWNRAIMTHGKGAFADKLGISSTALNKQLTGSMPDMETIDSALDAEPSILDDYLGKKGKRLVDATAVCDVDDASVLITRLLLWLHEAQHPDSAGGRKIVHSELLPAEFMIRQLHQATANWLAQISELRGAA
jgi:hypothetical protein